MEEEVGVQSAIVLSPSTTLIKAVEEGNLELVKLHLKSSASVGLAYDGKPLFTALQNGHLEVVKLLLERGADVNALNDEISTPLCQAAQRGHLEMVKLLLEHGAKIDILSPINAAARCGRTEVVKFLLDKGAYTACLSYTVSAAARKGQLEVVKLLLEHGASVNTEEGHHAPLYVACQKGHLEIAEMLLEFGAPVDVATSTPIYKACEKRHWEVAKLLLEHNASVNIANTFVGDTPLFQAIKGGSVEVTRLLLERGANPNQKDNNQCSVLHAAVIGRKAEIVWHLTLFGADTTTIYRGADSTLKTVWELATGYEELTEALMHFWTPTTHKLHPRWTREAITCTLLVARHLGWPFDRLLLHKMLAFIAFGWYQAPGTNWDHDS